ncbi:hypothetical protein C5B85_01910 [Pseudoclavibacter sp. AY1F1]|uniref:hypothetical protein n=1 Tax=Pseudoclavibacter sp. AY1F1 TaxID=2080583 RepID=UPI000CE8B3DA|nr:hypothetical protein [Pseudoclavibacter sp. AY1F1]PPF47055.1 hypothetical protein C5B85_01910 [Pseudoclavibacter sp. AY1F1]
MPETPISRCTHGLANCLECKAREVRVLRLAVAAACPNPAHWHARQSVPCAPPSERHPRGTACPDRLRYLFEHQAELTARAEQLQRAAVRRDRAEWRAQVHERNAERRRSRNAEIIRTIHHAASTPTHDATTTENTTTRSTP